MTGSVFAPIIGIGLAALLAACGGGGGSSGGTGTLSLAVTDAPVDDASAVFVQITGVALKPAGGNEIPINFDEPRTINLLALQGGNAAGLLDGSEVLAGQYEWIRLLVNAQRGASDSYIIRNDDPATRHSLFIPSGAETGLKLVSGFTVPANGSASFTIDFDLRKSVFAPGAPEAGQAPVQDYILRPALRMVDNAQAGNIAGGISAAALSDQRCPNTDPSRNSNAVYVFKGANVTPGDVGSSTEPVTTARASAGSDGTYTYRAAFLSPGEYTVAFTCQAANDQPGQPDTLVFLGTKNVTVASGSDAAANF